MPQNSGYRKQKKKSLVFYLLFLVTFLGLAPVYGQHYNFRTYSVEEGLAQSQIYFVYQCRRGYLWIGTYGGGLSRFDGKNFTNYSTKDGLSDNVIYAMIEDPEGNLWMGTDVGVNKYDGKTFTALTAGDGLLQDKVRTLYRDREGRLWLGTYSGGLSCLKDGRYTHFTTAQGLTDNRIRSIIQDRKGDLWIGTLNGLNKFNGTAFIDCPLTEKLKDRQVFCILEDREGRLWFGTDLGLHYFDGKTLTGYTTREGLCNEKADYIFEDSSGRFWIATETGTSCFDLESETFTTYTTKEGLCHDHVESIMEDREGNLWFATDSGISKFSGNRFTYFSTREGLRSDMVWAIWEAPGGVTWLGTEKGVTRYNAKDSSLVPAKEKWLQGITFPFYRDRERNLWFGTGTAIIKYDGKVFANLSEIKGLEELNVFSILEDRGGNYWFATELNGVKKYDGKTVTTLNTKSGLVDDLVYAIHEDHRGNLWFGTNGGISIYDDGTGEFTNITTKQWLTNNYVMCILEDPENNFWIGTYGQGVIKYTPSQKNGKGMYTDGSIETFTTRDGLVDDEILLMIFDNNGNLWLGTNKGIGVLDIAEFKKTGRKIFKYYGKEDGFFGIECNQNAVYKDSKGNLWFGTIRGAIKYEPGQDRPNRVEPVVHITGVNLFYETRLGVKQHLELSHHQNHLTFEFIGISLTVPEKVRYQVRLEGFDANWSPVSRTNFITYSNLPPGSYTFKVKACNNDGVWSKKPTEYRFRIKTPYWMSWWFFMAAGAAAIGGILGFIKIRVRHLKKRQRDLEAQVRMRTMELETEKGKVEQINRELEQRVEERTNKLEIANKQLLQAQKMEAIGTLASGVAHDLNNILGGIVNYPELLLMEIPNEEPFLASRKYITAMQRSGEKAAAIVQDLLALSRRRVTISNPLNLNRVISEFMESPELENILSYHPGVWIETQLADDLFYILGSPVHLSKILMNLASNAAEAMPSGGKILVSTENHSLTKPIEGCAKLAKGRCVVLKVSDTGIGISKADIEHIFEPFYTKKKMGRSGTGLGMTVVWGTVRDHDGYIEVQSEEGKGTTMTLYFPATHQTPPEEKKHIPLGHLRGNGETILVVDDVEEQREITTLMLRQLGYSPQACSGGEAAIEYVTNNPVDLVVLDMIMDPGMGGLETYKRILNLYPHQKAIIVSGYSETRDVRAAQLLGAGAYVKKPYGMETIGRAVKEELGRNTDPSIQPKPKE